MKTKTEYVFSQTEVAEMTIGALVGKFKEMGVEADPKGISFKGVNCDGELVFNTPNYEMSAEEEENNSYNTLEDAKQDCLIVRVTSVTKTARKATRRRR